MVQRRLVRELLYGTRLAGSRSAKIEVDAVALFLFSVVLSRTHVCRNIVQ